MLNALHLFPSSSLPRIGLTITLSLTFFMASARIEAQELETCYVFCYEKTEKGPWCSEIFDAGRFIWCKRQGFGFFNMCWERHIDDHPNIEARGDSDRRELESERAKLCGRPI